METEYTLGDEMGEITRQSENALFFKDGTANLLPVGTKIYDTDAPFYIVILDGKEIPYLPMLEG